MFSAVAKGLHQQAIDSMEPAGCGNCNSLDLLMMLTSCAHLQPLSGVLDADSSTPPECLKV